MKVDLLSWLLEHYGQEQPKPDPELSRLRRALGTLVSEIQKKTIVTIAGTNGKGETTLRLSGFLGTRSHTVWISPHVTRLTERFRSEDGEISEAELQDLVFQCHGKLQGRSEKLSFYEFLFFVFLTWSKNRNPETLLLEVGLGGRLDAVNVFGADLVLLPSISRDHQEFLGNRYDLILREKLALMRPGKTLLSYLSLDYLRLKTQELQQQGGFQWKDFDELELAPAYDFSRRNQILAYAAFRFLQGESLDSLSNFDENFPHKELVPLESRGELLSATHSYLLFGSHNVDGMRKLIQFLHSGTYNFFRPPYDGVIVAFSRRDVRDQRVLLRMLKEAKLGEVLVTVFSHPKAASPALMQELATQEGLRFVHDSQSYVQGQNEGPKTFLVTGSYYFLGDFKTKLARER